MIKKRLVKNSEAKNKSLRRSRKKLAINEVKPHVEESKLEKGDEGLVEVTLMFVPYKTRDEMLLANGVKGPKK